MTYNRSEICRNANDLVKKGYSKSEAFVEAWAIAKGKVSTKANQISSNPKEAREEAREEANDLTTNVRKYKELQELIKGLESQAELLKDSIIGEMDGKEELVVNNFRIKYNTVISNRLDTTKFKKEQNDIYRAYLKESTARRFSISVI